MALFVGKATTITMPGRIEIDRCGVGVDRFIPGLPFHALRKSITGNGMNRSHWPAILFWAGFALFVTSFIACTLWRGIAVQPVAGFICLVLISLALAAGVRRIFHCTRATATLLVWSCAMVYFSGFASVLAVALIAAAAMAIGSILIPAGREGSSALAVLVGLALFCGTVGWLLPFPVHSRVVYVVVLASVVALRWRVVASVGRSIGASWSTAVAMAPRASFLTIMCIGLASTCAWLPTLSYDALVYHLALPSQLAQFGYYQMNAGSNVWALAPWVADVLQGVAWVLAGAESTGAVSILWFGLTLVLLWRLARELDLAPWLCWMAVALYGSLPLVAGLLVSMQTEGPTAAALVGVALVIQSVRVPERRHLVVVGVLFGLLLALKVSNLMFAAPLGLWLLWRWRGRMPWRALPLTLLLACVVAGSSYVYAYALTGNPVLPLFNGYFRSPFYPLVDFNDQRWDTGLPWNLPWLLVFKSSIYDEAGNGLGPFVLIALGGSLLAALCRKRSVGLALVALAAFVLPLTQIQYLRYAMPVLVLMIPAMLCGIRCESINPRHLRGVVFALCSVVIVSLMFVSSATWQLKSGALLKLLGGGRERVIQRYAVERDFSEVIRHRYGERARTLLVDPARPFAADFAGQGLVTAWYDPQLSGLAANARAVDTVAAWSSLFDRSGANLLLVSKDGLSPGMKSAIDAYHGSCILTVGGFHLWELRRQSEGGMRTESAIGLKAEADGWSGSLPAGAAAQVDLVTQRNLARRARDTFAFWGKWNHARVPGP